MQVRFDTKILLHSAMCSLSELGQTYVRETGCIDLLLQLFR